LQEFITIPHKIETILQRPIAMVFYENLGAALFFAALIFCISGAVFTIPSLWKGALKLKRNFLHSRRRLSGGRNEARPEMR